MVLIGFCHYVICSEVSFIINQTCVKYCSQAERETVFEALRPHFLTLARKKYAVHLVKKLLDNGMTHNLYVESGLIAMLPENFLY